MIKRSGEDVRQDLEAIALQSPFLQKAPSRTFAYFDRSEIRTGRLVGRGGYADVYEITGFDLNPEVSMLVLPEFQAIRETFASNAVNPNTGKCRYVIKQLQEYLVRERASFITASSDLVLEGAYLSRLDHPNVLSLRGLPARGIDSFECGTHDSYFLILDHLEATLETKMDKWRTERSIRRRDKVQQEKTMYALQLADALSYLHDNRLIFRDLKPQNIGFDVFGNLQLFDFGLCRELPEGNSDRSLMYTMSGVGTRRYMAPEIVLYSRYNQKVDVYSWAIVVWQMFTLCKPFSAYNVEDHRQQVCVGGERPHLTFSEEDLPLEVSNILCSAWEESVSKRLNSGSVLRLLRRYVSQKQENKSESGSVIATFTPDGVEVSPRPTTRFISPTVFEMESMPLMPFEKHPDETGSKASMTLSTISDSGTSFGSYDA